MKKDCTCSLNSEKSMLSTPYRGGDAGVGAEEKILVDPVGMRSTVRRFGFSGSAVSAPGIAMVLRTSAGRF
eukprot:1507187-Rhodomonas_salina.5